MATQCGIADRLCRWHTLWQLAMCEFALEHLDDIESSPKQLQLRFRALCEEARHPAQIPRLRGSLQIE